MSFGQWYLRRGRISRRTWWLHYGLVIVGLAVLATIADTVLGYPGLVPEPADAGTLYGTTGGPFELLVTLGTIVPSISSTVARLHDRDHSAWWLLWWLLPVVGWIVLFVDNGFLRGTPGPNRYGPPTDVPIEPVPA